MTDQYDIYKTPPKRPAWDAYFLEIARAVSLRSDCERDKVGAVVVKDNRLRGSGYNGSPAGKPGCLTCPRRVSDVAPGSDYNSGPGRCVALHAEMNCALYASRADLIGGSMFVTRKPCAGCEKMLSGSGLKEVIWPDGRVEFS